jgi:hypothetical protein
MTQETADVLGDSTETEVRFDGGGAAAARVSYPCYKSFDEFIDVQRLIALDGYIAERIKRHIQAQRDMQFYTGPYRLNEAAPDRPGSRMIYLAQSQLPDSYFDYLVTDICHEFVWFRTNLLKPFYMLNHETDEKLYVESYSAWFDSVNQFHGSDACDGLSFTSGLTASSRPRRL